MAMGNKLMLGASDMSALPGVPGSHASPSTWFSGDIGVLLLIVVSIGIVLFVWAKFIRKRHRRRTEEPAPATAKVEPRRRKMRSEHRPRNPTLAETGGLPPVRSEDASKPPIS